jgi:hypothetical protein
MLSENNKSSSTSKSSSASPPPSTAPLPTTPSKLRRYLQHAEADLGIQNAARYEATLGQHAYGPDILHIVKDKTLVEAGILPGDAIRLKRGCQAWMETDAKRQKLNPPLHPKDPEPTLIRVEKRFYGGGGTMATWATELRARDGDEAVPQTDFEWWYRCDVRKEMVRLPEQFEPVLQWNDVAPINEGTDW